MDSTDGVVGVGVVQVGRCANFCLFKGDKCKVTLSLQRTRSKRTHKRTHARARPDLYARARAQTGSLAGCSADPPVRCALAHFAPTWAHIPTARTASSAPRLASQGFSFSPIASKCVLHSEAFSAPNLDASTPFEYYERDPSRVYRHAPLLPA
jgi:hypothetical protein